VRAACAGPELRGQRFPNEQTIRGPLLAAHKGPVQACLQVYLGMEEELFMFLIFFHIETIVSF